MDQLRENCPWDKKQTNETLRHLTIEETYELSDAILNNNPQEIKSELGDLLLHIVFYSKIASETQAFTINEVIDGVCEKLVRRHPHIYGDTVVSDAEQVKENWEQIKLKENSEKTVLSGVPNSMPSLVKAIRIQDKASSAGFDWDKPEQVWEKVQEELGELQEAVAQQESQDRVEEELGDVIFSLVNYARFIGVNPEDALEKTNRKFIQRFNYIELQAKNSGKKLTELSLEQMDAWWNESKLTEKN